jgi:regulatory protein
VVLQRLREGVEGRGVCLTFSDGSSFFVPIETIPELHLSPGLELDEDLFALLQEESLYFMGKEKALDLLGRRDHSCGELRIKLMQRDYPPRIIDRIIQRMKELGLLDDARFASSWIALRTRRHCEGRIKLLASLSRKGVERAVAEDALNHHFSDQEEDEALQRAADQLLTRSSATARSVTAALLRKGFPQGKVYRIIEKNFTSFKGLH